MSTDSEAASAPACPSGPTGRLATWLAEVAAKDILERVRERPTAHAHTVEVNEPIVVRSVCGHLRLVSTAENEAIVMRRAQERRPSTRRGRGAAPPGPRS